MNKVELLNYIHWFSLKTQFKNTSGAVQLRLHNSQHDEGYGRYIKEREKQITPLVSKATDYPHFLIDPHSS